MIIRRDGSSVSPPMTPSLSGQVEQVQGHSEVGFDVTEKDILDHTGRYPTGT